MDEQNNEFVNEEINTSNNEAMEEPNNEVVVKSKKGRSKGFFFIFSLLCIITIAFWVMRNMEQFSFLAPMG